jgi:Mn2+/Fe2+ NRAMP family transporter
VTHARRKFDVALTLTASVAYVLSSLQIAFWAWISPLFCQDDDPCVRHWTAHVIVKCAGWIALGVVIALALRRVGRRERREHRSLNQVSASAVIGVIAGLTLSVLLWFSGLSSFLALDA